MFDSALRLLCLYLCWLVSGLGLLAGCTPHVALPAQELSHALRAPLTDIATPMGPAQAVALPDAWERDDRSGLWRYDLEFTLAEAPLDAWALYIPRAGNRLAVHINGTQVAQWGHFTNDTSDASLAPRLALVPSGLLHVGLNQVRVTVQGERARQAGLAPVLVGPLAVLQPIYQGRDALQSWGSFAMVVVALSFALVAALMGRLMRDRTLWWLALACVCIAISTLHLVVAAPPLDYRLWDALAHLAHMGYLLALMAVASHVLRWPCKGHGMEWLLVAATVTLVPLHAWGRSGVAREVWLLLALLYAGWLLGRVAHSIWRARATTPWALLACGLLALALAAHAMVGRHGLANGYVMIGSERASLLVVLVLMVWLLAERHRALMRREAAAHARSEAELRQQRQLLEGQFEVQRSEARQQARRQERQRILRDIHDGMGLQLSGLLSLAQSAEVGPERLTREVRIAIEQMRLLVDNADAFEGDVGMLLGQIRYQIGRRLAHTDTTLHWQTALSYPGRVLRPAQAVALQRLVFELTTNVLKHAKATQVEVLVRDDATGGLHLTFADNGIGFNAVAHKLGIGLRSIHGRAEEMGAKLERLPSTAGMLGTRYRLSLPPQAFES